MTTKLDSFEHDIENNASSFKPISSSTKNVIENIIDSAKKSKNINIRISEYDLEKLREKSFLEGLPYQTLISSIIHKYVSNQLIDGHSVTPSA